MKRAGKSLAAFAALLLAGLSAACSTRSAEPSTPGVANAAGGSAGGGPGPSPSSSCGESQLGLPRLRRLSRSELLATLADVFPEVDGAWSPSLSADALSPQGFDNDATLLVVGKQLAAELDSASDALGAAVSGAALPSVLPCAAVAPDASCAQQFLDKYGKRLFRRALTMDENARYQALFQQVVAAKDFASGIRFLTRALVQSPHAVYRYEVGVVQNGVYTLSPSELAAELAYDFSGTTPSPELLAQAEAGQLATPAALQAKARELLQSEAGLRTVEKFFDAWLGYGRAASVTKPGVPEFASLREQMVAETRLFLGQVVVTENGGLNELLTAPFSMPSAAVAAFYGFPAPSADYAKTPRPAGRGLGILAQASLLSTLSGPSASSPTKRGLLVMQRLLCREKREVPPGVPPLSAPAPGMFTTRQHYEMLHATAPTCKACHSQFDPIGYGFEHYDEVGRYRDQDGGLPVDSKSYVPGESDDAHLFDFENLEQLAQGLAAQQLPYLCTSGYLSSYVNGGAEACLGESQRGAFVAHQMGFMDYLASLAAEPHFRQRRLQ